MSNIIRELISKAFELAYFVHKDKKIAINIATESVALLEIALLAQDKRAYYKLSGRGKKGQNDSPKYRTKVSMNELHLLQRLVYMESEIYEIEQEKNKASLSQESMTIRFIKYLIRVTTKRNSFYVNVGLSRLLYNYTTPQAMDIYGLIIQDINRIKDDAYYRSRKKQLVAEIQGRFGELIKTIRVERGEERFLTVTHANYSTIKLVEECLEIFTPWNTSCLMPEKFDPIMGIIEGFSFNGTDPDQEHPIELNRMHCIIHPQCYWRLTMSLNFDSPDTCLDLPDFQLSKKDEDIAPPSQNNNDGSVEKLSDSELATIEQVLASYEDKRKTNPKRFLSVVIDGVEKAQLDIYQSNSIKLHINGEIEQIAIRKKEDNLLLALYMFNESQAKDSEIKYSNIIESGQEVTIILNITRGFEGFINSTNITVNYTETAFYRKFLLSVSKLFFLNNNFGDLRNSLAFASVLVAILFVYFYYRQTSIETVSTPKQTPKPLITPISKPNQETLPNKNSIENTPDLVTQQNTPSPIPSPKANKEEDIVVTNKQNEKVKNLAEISKNSSDEDLLIYRNPQDSSMARSLSEVKSIYVDKLGENKFSQEIRANLIEQLSNSKIIKYNENLEIVDGVIKGSVTERNGDDFIISLKLVNAEGETLWSISTKKIKKKEVHRLPILLNSIIKNLIGNIEKSGK